MAINLLFIAIYLLQLSSQGQWLFGKNNKPSFATVKS